MVLGEAGDAGEANSVLPPILLLLTFQAAIRLQIHPIFFIKNATYSSPPPHLQQYGGASHQENEDKDGKAKHGVYEA